MTGLIFADVTMSLDGFITGPNDSVDQPIGEGGERLHEWLFELASFRRAHGLDGGHTGPDDDLLDEAFERSGATVMGRRMFDHGLGSWGDVPPFREPVFVLTHKVREPLVKSDTTFTFITDGIEKAVEMARTAAEEKDVSIGGGASVIQQALNARLLDEIQVHLVPIFMGGGVRLFENLAAEQPDLRCTRVVETTGVVHLRFEVAAAR
jgi:dihydrofolate reductase